MFPKKDGELNFNPVKDLSIEELENLEKSLPKGERSLAGFLYPNNHEAQAIMYKLLQLVEHMPLDATAYNKFIAQIASMLPLPEPYLIASNKIFADMQKLLLGRVDYTTPNIIDRWERAAKISREITPEFKDLKTPNPPFGTNLLFNKDNFYFSRRLSKRQLLKRYPNAANSKDGLKEFYKETRFYLQTFGNFFLLDVAPYAELLKVENEKDLNVGGYATLNNTIVLDLAREFKNRAPEEFTTIFAHEFTHILQHVFFERLDHTGLLAEVFNSHLLSFNENSGSSGMLNNMFLAAMEKLFGYILAPIEVNAREKSLWLVNGIYNPSNPLHPYLTSLGITLPYGNPDPQFNGLVQSYLNPFLSFNTIKHNTTNNLQKSVEGIAKKVSFNITGYTNPPIGYNQDRVNNFVHKLASALSADNVGFISSPALGGKDIGTSLKFVQKEYNNTKNKIPLLTIATKDEIQSIYTNGLKKFDITNYGRQKKVVFPNSQIKLEEAVKIGDITMIIGGRNNSLNTFFNAMSYLKNIIIVDDQTFGNGAINLATNSTDNAARYVAEQYQAIMKGRPLPYKPSSEFEKSVWETIEKFPEVFKEKILVINMEDANAVSKIKKFTKPILQAKGKAKGKIKDSDSSKGIDKIASKVRPVAASVLPKDTPEFVRNFPTNRITKKVVKTTNPNQLSLFGTGYGITFAPSSAPITSLETEFAAATETANIDPEVKKAVVKVLTGTSQGSGFYTKINNRPFIVTAGHVINNSRNNFIIDETITLANDNGIIGTAKLWDYTIKDGIDFALYTVDQNIMTGIKPLKLSKEALKQGENATALGYPKSNNALLTSKHVFINNPLFTDDGNLPFPACLLTGNCGLGFSGGPVLNKNGKVFGMLIKSGIGSDLSIAMPLGIIKNFLNNPLKSKIPITVKQTANSTINIENTYQKLEIINKLEKQALSELPENWDDSKRSLVAPNPGTQQSGIKFINAMLGGDNNPLGFSKGQIENLIGIKRFLNQGEYSNYEISIASIANIAKSGDIHYVFVGKSIENIAQYAKTLEANGDGVIFIRIKSNPFLYINESTLLPVLPTDGQKIAFTVKVHSSLVYGKLRPEFSRLEDPNEILEPKNFATNLQAFFDRTGTKEITVFMETCAAGAFIPEFMALPEDLRKGINIITTTNGNESRGVMEYNQYLIHGGSSTDARIEGLLSSGKIGAQYIKGGEVYNPLAEAVKQAKNLTEPYQGIPAETLQRDLQALDNLYNKVAINDNGHLTEILQTLPEYIFHIEQGDGRPYFPAFTADIKNLNHSRVSDSKARIKIPDYVANYVAEVFKNNMPHFAGTPKLPLAGFTNSSAPLSISSVPQTPTTLNPAAKPANIATVKPDIGSYGGGGVEIINNLEREALKKLPEDIVQKKEVFFNYVAPTTNPNSYSIEFIDNLLNQKDLNLQENIVNNLEAIKASLQNPEGVINISIASVANIARGGNISYVLMGQGIEEIAPYAKQLETSGDGVIFISGDNNIFKLFNIQDTWATLPKLKLPNNNLLISLKTHSYISTQKHGFYSFIVINESPYSQRIFLSDLLKYTQKLALTTDAKKITLFLSTCHAAQFMNNLLTFPPLVRKGLNIITTTAVSEDGKLKSYNLSFPKGSNPADERIKSVLRYGNIGLMYMIDGQRYFPLETAVKAAKKRKEPYQGIPGDILYKELLALHKLYTVQTGEDYWLTWALNALPKHMFKKAPGHTFRSFAANTAIKIDPTDKKITYNVKIPQYIADYIVEVFESDMPHFAGDVAK
ncbi:MAG: serine protease [Elusimicrobiota bacterium]|jgi:S1-C subfamily serine protease|nr:serine protease [Elusimicrobiota bacterium]